MGILGAINWLWICVVVGISLLSCGRGEPGKSGGGGATEDLTVSENVTIRTFDDDCKDTNYIRVDSGKSGVIHLEIIGANSTTHAIGFTGNSQGASVTFTEARIASPAEGKYSFDVVVRNIKLCKNDSTAGLDCNLTNKKATGNHGFDTSATVNFVVATPLDLNSDQLETPGGFIGDLLSGSGFLGGLGKALIGSLGSLGGNGGGLLGGLLGSLGGGQSGGGIGDLLGGLGGAKDEPPAVDPNKGKCINGTGAQG